MTPIGDYVKTVYNKGVAPAINDVSLNHAENKIEELDTGIAALLADYEYQPPVIVGTQIQLVKQSDTDRLFFKLAADLTGGAITISLDGGATSVPLQGIDGAAITELSKGFVEVVDNTTFFTYAPKGGKNVKSSQSGITTMVWTLDVNKFYCDVPITAVDLAKAVLFPISYRVTGGGSSSPRDNTIKGYLLNSNTIRFICGNDPTAVVSWNVKELENIKSIQSLEVSLSVTTEVSTLINEVNPEKTYLIDSTWTTNSSDISSIRVKHRLIDSTHLGSHVAATPSYPHIQIIQFK